MRLERAIGPGRLIAVVGPSGSGKDTIMRAAKSALAGGDVAFPKRVITRGADDHEDHLPVCPSAFRSMAKARAFALAWNAHGLSYGIPRRIDDMIRNGRTVVLNVSRTIVPQLRERYQNLTVASVSVDPLCLERRLSERQRETPLEITRRLARARQEEPAGADVVVIDNNGRLEDAVRQFLSVVSPPDPPA